MQCSTAPGDSASPAGVVARTVGATPYSATQNNATMAPQSLAPAGGSQPHNNMMPYLTCYFNIALQGVFPPRG
jgi:microcystin-dependent protein